MCACAFLWQVYTCKKPTMGARMTHIFLHLLSLIHNRHWYGLIDDEELRVWMLRNHLRHSEVRRLRVEGSDQ